MDLLQAILLGILQGITEFLPVSSSGHLALARAFIGEDIEPGITFEIVVHFGSFCSIVLYYRYKLFSMLKDLFISLTPAAIRSKRFLHDENTKLLFFILISMVPAMLVGFTLKDQVEVLFVNPVFVSVMLLVTGTLLFITQYVPNKGNPVTANRGFWLGLAQAFAILPGISRAGSTISLGLYMGMDRDKVANFSFLMVLPVLAGAMLLEVLDLFEKGVNNINVPSLFAGYLTSFLVGYAALSFLIKLLKRDKLHYFSYYCWTVGIFSIIYFI